jgi:CSLREA domain-containing protein
MGAMRATRPGKVAVALSACFLVAVLVPTAALGATVGVNTGADDLDAVADSDCSLREAIASVNQGSSFGGCTATGTYGTADAVTLGSGSFTLTRAPGVSNDNNDDGDLDVLKPVSINGAAADLTTIDADDIDRAIHVISDASNAVNVTLNGLTVANGAPPNTFNQNGGAIRAEDGNGTFTINDSEIIDSDAVQGGAVVSLGPLVVDQSTMAGNQASFLGGAITTTSQVTITNSTLAQNSVSDSGAAIYAYQNSGPVSITSSTIAGNSAGNINTGALQGENGPGAPVVTVVQSILSGNTVPGSISNCDDFRELEGSYDGTYVLEDADTCGFSTDAGDHNLLNTEPLLAPLTLSPVSTVRTMALRDGSPAIEAVPAADCAVAVDERGVTRPQGTDCDIGAFEKRSVDMVFFTLTVDPDGSGAGSVTGTGIDCGGGGSDCSEAVEDGSQAILTATPASGSVFAGWIDCDSASGDQCTMTMDADKAVTATFNAVPTDGGGGGGGGGGAIVTPPTCKGRPATIFPRPGLARTFNGTNKKDVIVGTSKKDKINAGGGNDLVCAKGGKDTVKGGGGKDTLLGQGGNDTLKGGPGKDTLKGGPGSDVLIGGPGRDRQTQ